MLRLPGWLAFVLFVPLQVYLFVKLSDAWGFWWSLAFFFALGLVGARAARAHWLRAALFPRWAREHEENRHWYLGALFLAAALAWLVPTQLGAVPAAVSAWAASWPQPWLPLAFGVTLAKAGLR